MITAIKMPEIRECWKAKEAAENKEKVKDKVNCPFFGIYNHKGNARQTESRDGR